MDGKVSFGVRPIITPGAKVSALANEDGSVRTELNGDLEELILLTVGMVHEMAKGVGMPPKLLANFLVTMVGGSETSPAGQSPEKGPEE